MEASRSDNKEREMKDERLLQIPIRQVRARIPTLKEGGGAPVLSFEGA